MRGRTAPSPTGWFDSSRPMVIESGVTGSRCLAASRFRKSLTKRLRRGHPAGSCGAAEDCAVTRSWKAEPAEAQAAARANQRRRFRSIRASPPGWQVCQSNANRLPITKAKVAWSRRRGAIGMLREPELGKLWRECPSCVTASESSEGKVGERELTKIRSLYNKLSVFNSLAEREGFEPSIEFPLYTLSKRAPSTTRPSLRFGCAHLFNSA